MGVLQSLIGFLGRALLSLIFISSGLHKILNWDGTEQFLIQGLNQCLGMSIEYPWLQGWIELGVEHSYALLVAATAVELFCGLMVFLGVNVRFGALLLFLFLIPTTAIFHHFWMLQGPERELQSIMFLKNLSIMGGLLLLVAYGRRGCKSTQCETTNSSK